MELGRPGLTLSFDCLIKLLSGLHGSNDHEGHTLSVRADYGVTLARGKDLSLLFYQGWGDRDYFSIPFYTTLPYVEEICRQKGPGFMKGEGQDVLCRSSQGSVGLFTFLHQTVKRPSANGSPWD